MGPRTRSHRGSRPPLLLIAVSSRAQTVRITEGRGNPVLSLHPLPGREGEKKKEKVAIVGPTATRRISRLPRSRRRVQWGPGSHRARVVVAVAAVSIRPHLSVTAVEESTDAGTLGVRRGWICAYCVR